MFVMLAAVFCAVFGSKLIVISALGSPVPLLDQWDVEAAGLYSPYLKGTLSFPDLFAAHLEHRIPVFRLLALAHLELAGEWNTRLEMIFGAVGHTAAVTWLAALLMPLVARQRRMLLAGFVAFLFGFPVVYENALWGLQLEVYLSLLFGIATLVAFAAARPFSARWFGGLVAAVLSYFSFATGVAAILAAGVLVTIQLAINVRKRRGRELAGLVVMASIALVMVLWTASGANPMSTAWTFIQGLTLLFIIAGAALVPAVWFLYRATAERPRIADRSWVAVGIVVWLVIQFVLLAYGRGAAVGVRYMDFVLPMYPVGLVAVFGLGSRAQTARFGGHAGVGAAAWSFAVVAVIALFGYHGSVLGAMDWSKVAGQQTADVRAFLATGDVGQLRPKGPGGHGIQLSHPSPQRLSRVLTDPEVRAILPVELRPPDSGVAEIRKRMWLKGTFARGTAAAVHLIPAAGPALLATALALFFAVAARRSQPGWEVVACAASSPTRHAAKHRGRFVVTPAAGKVGKHLSNRHSGWWRHRRHPIPVP